MKLSTKLKISAGAMAVAAIAATSAQALTNTYQVSVVFAEPFTMTNPTPGNLGELANANASYTQAPATGVITPTTPGGGVTDATNVAASVVALVEGSATLVDITVDNAQAGANGFLTIDGFACTYNAATAGGPAADCLFDGVANPGAGTNLTIGFNFTVAGNPADAATDTADYDVTILFN